MLRLLLSLLLLAPLGALGQACPTFAAGDTDYISKLNLLSSGCVPNISNSYAIPKADAGGTVSAITADFTPDITLTDKMLVMVVSLGTNVSTAPTFTPDGLTTRTIFARGGVALRLGDIGPAGFVMLLEYNLANTRWELLNPAGVALGTPTSGTLTNATGLPISTGVTGLGTGVGTFLATPSSANLGTALTDETGSGLAVFGTAPTITNPVIANINPGANFTVTQNSVVPFTSVNASAVANTLYLSAGRVGLGVTTFDSWNSNYKTVALGAANQFAIAAGSASAYGLVFSNGAYLDSGLAWTYGKTQAVSAYLQASGTHQMSVAASGTAGNPVTMVTGLLIDNNGMNTPYSLARSVVTETAASRTILASDNHIICNRAGTITLTFPSAATYLYREIYVRTITANTVVSASSNVVPLAGGAAGTAILAATAGKWAKLVSDGTNWQIMAGN